MIEGSLSDVSLPGLLQFLATESNKSFKVSLESAGQKGDLLVSAGEILSANFGLLDGNDALTELLFWPEGTFQVERLEADFAKSKLTGSSALKIPLKQVNTFADQMVFLREASVGLNSEIVPSLSFGTQAWQEALAKQPLLKEDYAVLGWITDGRTMRQAMREFNFDVVRATSSLFRLLVTGSVEILRPTLTVAAIDGGETPINGLAAILDSMQPLEESDGAFDASPVVEITKPALETKSESKSETKFEPKPIIEVPINNGTKTNGKPASVEPNIATSEPKKSNSSGSSGRTMQSDVGTATGATINAVPGFSRALEAVTVPTPVPIPQAAPFNMGSDRDVITCDSLPAVGSAEFNEIMAKAQKASQQPLEYAKDMMKELINNPAQVLSASSQAETQQITLPTSFRSSSDKIAAVNADGLTVAKAAALARQAVSDTKMQSPSGANKVASSAANSSTSASSSSSSSSSHTNSSTPSTSTTMSPATVQAWAVAVGAAPAETTGKVEQAKKVDSVEILPPAPAPKVVEESPEKRLFDIVRTDPLPIVAIDIERLFQTVFHVSPFGHISLGNNVLDDDLQKILQDFKMGKNFITVATEEQMQPAQVLHHCKYCLERGYLDPPDAVASLTADLLLGRVELEQYLLQRRRITGDELRDVVEVARQKSIKLTDLLVKLGFMTASDWDRLCQEKERFARR